MKTRTLLIAAAMLFTAIGASAQPPAPLDVVPGSKGVLPISELPQLGQLEDGHFAGLLFQSTGYYHNYYFDSYTLLFNLSAPLPKTLEGESYTLQYRENGGDGMWKTKEYSLSEGAGYDNYTYEVREFPFEVTDWRLVLNGGPRDGYVSNFVTVRMPGGGQLFTNPGGWSMGGTDMDEPKLVGSEYGSSITLSTTTHVWGASSKSDSTYQVSSGYYRYNWYRIDPNTYEETRIEGATDSTYTPTFADAGHILVKEICGDEEHCSFYYRFYFGQVAICVQASPDYVGPDGFVLNTDYVIPNPENAFVYDLEYYWSEDGTVPEGGRLPEGTISTRKDGQYVFRLSQEEYDYQVFNLNIPGCVLKVCYMMEQWDENGEIIGEVPWYREFQVMSDRYMAPMIVTPKFDGSILPTTVDVIGKNIDGEYVVLATNIIEEGATEGIYFDQITTLGGGVYLKAYATASTAETYYPKALTMAAATPVVPAYDEEWNPLEFVIDVQPAGATPDDGDVNGDGEVGIGDIVSITNVMAGIGVNDALQKAADVNGDGEVGIGDIVAITNIMAGK